MTTIGLVAGESSGDLLGAGLIKAIRARRPDARFVGVAGPAMAAAGCEVLADSERLAVTGIAEVVEHLPGLLAFRRRLVRDFTDLKPDVFVGIDSPDFNLGLEARLKARGLRTIQYVSPSIWAWRAGRIKTIAKAVDRVLALLPFEKDLYDARGIDAVFVGHPLADEIAAVPDRAEARRRLKWPPDSNVLALLPGSRRNELDRLAPLFLETAERLTEQFPGLIIAAPMASPTLARHFDSLREGRNYKLDLRLIEGHSREVMSAADAVLLASGTAALEAMLLARPMAVAYRLAPMTRVIVQGLGLLKIEHVSLPNLLAGREIVPEFLQERARADLLTPAMADLLDDPDTRARQLEAFAPIAATLARDASSRAAEAVLELVEGHASTFRGGGVASSESL
ncbi:MAG TPA: lipid-A-disaccharide synthase [Gammaproteobacteria bacterium]|nr:lipid-A-disaccharide synthase [Gammaproteobacteria bacterium]